jgi:hypothetical protein
VVPTCDSGVETCWPPAGLLTVVDAEPRQRGVTKPRASNAILTQIPNSTCILTPVQDIASRYPFSYSATTRRPRRRPLGGLGSSVLPFFDFFNTPFGSFFKVQPIFKPPQARIQRSEERANAQANITRLTPCVGITSRFASPLRSLARLADSRPAHARSLARSILTLPYMLSHTYTCTSALKHKRTLSPTLSSNTHVSPPLTLPRTRQFTIA